MHPEKAMPAMESPVQESKIVSAIHEADIALARAETVAAELCDKLQGVRLLKDTCPQEDNAKRAPACELCNSIYRIIDRVNGVSERLENTLGELEL